MTTAADTLVQTALQAGVEICFANPGTTEMPLVIALDRTPGMRVVLGLFEGVCSGAADGWARMRGRPAATLLHLGPGLANGLANLHNARRAGSPVVNWIGEHPSRHLRFDPPLNTDIAALAACVGWSQTVATPQAMAAASLAAVRAALGPPGRVATLIIPADCQWAPGCQPLSGSADPVWADAPQSAVQEAAALLRRGGSGLLLGGSALTVAGLRAGARVAAATGCPLWVETFPARQECGRHVPQLTPLPYFPEQAREVLADLAGLVLVGAREPVAFFAYPQQPSRLLPAGAQVLSLADPDAGVDAARALAALADALEAPAVVLPPLAAPAGGSAGPAPLSPDRLCALLAAQLPERAIVINEATTTGFTWNTLHAAQAAPHTMLFSTGGAIGQGLPNALGAALACPDRRVIAFQADGSGLYTLQALWTMVREQVDVTVVVCANRAYRILQVELARAGCPQPGPGASSLVELTRPEIRWMELARGFGMPASRVASEAEFAEALGRSLSEPGPSLIEALL